jgi:AraC-like DNA-binding protein
MNAIAERIHLIERIAHNDEGTLRMLDKVIEVLVEKDRKKLAGFRGKLAEFEQRYGMSTTEFQRRFDSGELGDASEWFDWDGFAALSGSLESKLKAVEARRE